jgi:predicted anti-sigma-YlaC factor YlaD
MAVNEEACERCRQWVSLELDLALSDFERVLMRRHLTGCPSCAAFADGVRGTTELLRSAEAVLPATRIGLPAHRRARAWRHALAGASVAASILLAAVALTANRLDSSSTSPVGQGGDVSSSSDLSSMRLVRRQQLQPPATNGQQVRVRVIEVD